MTFWTSVAFSLIVALLTRLLLKLLLGWHSPMYMPAKDMGTLVKVIKRLITGFGQGQELDNVLPCKADFSLSMRNPIDFDSVGPDSCAPFSNS